MSTVIYELSDHVATLTLNRPQALNALNNLMVDDLRQATAKAAFDPQVRAVVLCAAGDHFMAGGDLKWFRDQLTVPPAERQLRFEAMIASVHAAILNLKGMGKPAIAAVHGAVAGFGMSLMMACDLVMAADNAYFTLAYSNIALSPDGGATWSLPRQVGLKQAMEIALLGERFAAAIIATAPQHAGKLLPEMTANYDYEPIATVYLQFGPRFRLPFPLFKQTGKYGQWAVDRGDGLIGCVLSGHGDWEALTDEELAATLQAELPASGPATWHRVIREKRATFSCQPGIPRPACVTSHPRVLLAGDYTWADYPATLEGAVRSGRRAAHELLGKSYNPRS